MAEIKYESLPQGKRPILSWNAVVYSATSLGSTMMNSVFQFYYVKLFLNQYKITEDWFNIVQTIYMIWNAVNDPLFGYFQDNSKMAMFQERRLSILYGAPLFALCFLLPWFPWAGYEESPNWVVGLHLLTSLCFYDALYTFVLLAQCAIFSEMSKQHDARLQLIRYAQCASLIGSSTVLWAELFSDSLHNFHMFQCYCICVACLSWMFMRYTGIHATTNYKIQGESNSPNARIQDTENSIWKLSKQIISEKNFLMFVTMNFCQVFHLAFGSNFLAMFGDALIPSEDLTPLLRQFLYGSSFIVPQLLVILLGSKLVERFGSYKVILMSFYIKVISGILMFSLGRSHTWLLAVFFLMDVSLPNATFSFFNLSLTDIIDDDVVRFQRRSPLSSMMFGTNALFTKPAQSVAPMLVVSILNRHGYQSAISHGHIEDNPELLDAIFLLVCAVPTVLGVCQLLAWLQYTLRSSHLVTPKYIET